MSPKAKTGWLTAALAMVFFLTIVLFHGVKG